ncbi:NUDIX domain-containing protein [Agrobacterium vitis]|uniref:GDP-mannose pyrophosphatase n=2 Tax=Rhizobium/Agrobacterium group TaxID=227290 RepID=B9JUX6_ALLAM|nr:MULTISPECIES: NUDIX domain-containing protein [Rhizobium/Agrobacterium group]ACM36121.1 NTP pyrophosphohydrolase MutT family [Allorhizobium ampelinum S4]MCF1467013.1 NUDIX domain-containing protein [Agrobacterium vitis]MUO29761.1 NUDIX domain-containing protein [Agrobacterium vitis]MUO44323.1 NUDIX domain-containing protein [Agrobacterium vitis]MUP10987.1 NUDIX domain-containing protein [Agrobacterium vitis]
MSKFDATSITIVEDKTLWKGWSHLRKMVFDYAKPDGTTQRLSWEVFDRGHAVAILLHDPSKKTLLLVRQFRIPAYMMGDKPFLLEVPAGMTDGEDAEKAVTREVEEETGYHIAAPRFLFTAYMSPGAVTEKIHFFYSPIDEAQKLSLGGGLEAEHEDLELVEVPLKDAISMIERGDIVDGKTIMLLQWAALNLA